MSDHYDLSGVLPGAVLEELPPGTNLLILGPSMVGKRRLAIRMLGAEHDREEGILVVSTTGNTKRIVDEFTEVLPEMDPERIGIVDCSGGNGQAAIREISTEQVGSPGDLTGISIGTAKVMRKFSAKDLEHVRHGLISVSTLLQYLDAETVFKFLHIYTNRVQATDGLAVFTLDSGSHDQQTVSTMTAEFDGVVELREAADGTIEHRVKGFGGSPSAWAPLS